MSHRSSREYPALVRACLGLLVLGLLGAGAVIVANERRSTDETEPITQAPPIEVAKVRAGDPVPPSSPGPDDEGPHAPADRTPAATQVRTVDGATVRSFDLGNLDLGPVADPGRFRAPMRGSLVTPTDAQSAPLILINHLRYPACPNLELAFPCSQGTQMRFDEGMEYLAVALARKGYSSLIADLSPLYINAGVTQPYNQPKGLVTTLTTMLDLIDAANNGDDSTALGAGLRGAIDTSRMGLVGHSRSGTFAPELTRAFRDEGRRIASVLIYGGAFETEFRGRTAHNTPPFPRDVPFLGVIGSADRDTEYLGSRYLGRYVSAARTAPALMAIVPGLGHTFVNRTLSEAKIDDRICLSTCRPNAQHHRTFLSRTALRWFNTTLGDVPNTRFPMSATAALPAKLTGLPARWAAATNTTKTTIFQAGRHGHLTAFGRDARASVCFPTEPMVPFAKGDCRPAELGDLPQASRVAQVKLTRTSGVRVTGQGLRADGVRDVRGIVVNLAPHGDRADKAAASPLTIEVRTSAGRTATLRFTDHPALLNRSTPESSGVYPITTLRAQVPAWVRHERVVGVQLTSTAAGSEFWIRSVDLIQ